MLRGGCPRFYKSVGVREVVAQNGERHYEVLLDGYPLKTPATQRPYQIPTKGLALAMALEWDQQVRSRRGLFGVASCAEGGGGRRAYEQATYKGIETTYMPITGIATIALDEIVFDKAQAVERCARYLSTDTVCYFFPDEEDDRKLLRRQQRAWEPLLAWVKADLGIEVSRPPHMLSVCEHSEETYAKMKA
jgi:chaperone required for assembly of F1-ATPase